MIHSVKLKIVEVFKDNVELGLKVGDVVVARPEYGANNVIIFRAEYNGQEVILINRQVELVGND